MIILLNPFLQKFFSPMFSGITILQIGREQKDPAKVGQPQVGPVQIGPGQISIAQFGPA